MLCVSLSHSELKEGPVSRGRCDVCRAVSQERTFIELGDIKDKVCKICLGRAREWVVRKWLMKNKIYEATEERIRQIHDGNTDYGYNKQNNTLTLNNGDV